MILRFKGEVYDSTIDKLTLIRMPEGKLEVDKQG